MSTSSHPAFQVTDAQFQVVYDFLSFTFAGMLAATVFFWLRLQSIHEKYKSALVITGLVTFIASYHYLRIFNSWVDAYKYPDAKYVNGSYFIQDPALTGKPFNDAYRYMDWLLTVPLLLIEIIFVMDLSPKETVTRAWSLGGAAALMIILGYPGELILEQSQLNTRWIFWGLAMLPFLFIVYVLIIGLRKATNAEANPEIRSKLLTAQILTVVSWLTYPIVYIIPMLGAKGANAVIGIQLGYCVSDLISKVGVGFVIYNVTAAKSKALNEDGLLTGESYKNIEDAQ